MGSSLHWIVLPPLLGALFNLTLGRKVSRDLVHVVAIAAVAISFGVVVMQVFGPLWKQFWGHALKPHLDRQAVPATVDELFQKVYTWIEVGSFRIDLAFRLDTLSAVMCLIITFVGSLIHVYSAGYMAEEPRYAAYFGYLNLFTAAMLILVLGANMPVMFIGWEGVGVCSYLLIGFWFTNDAYASAGRKAFVVNRIGDFAFLLGMFLLFWATKDLAPGGSDLDFNLFRTPEAATAVTKGLWFGDRLAAVACILLFIGAAGKSAQIPLYVWLPDAMAGPTPVSALIHAATMVTAGVYMVARLSFLFAQSTTAMAVVAIVGMLTALAAAFMAFAQTDLKKVLAYSTVSQLGFMFVAVGTGNWVAGIFHLGTHAFFKAGLFLGAGSVMHAMSGSGDITRMGGLRKLIPITHATFFIYCLAIAGFPLLSGFFSKDEILAGAWGAHHEGWGHLGKVLWVGLTIAALGTAFYMWRLYFLVFAGENRSDEVTRAHIHESPATMTFPLVVLAIFTVGLGVIGLPHIIPEGSPWFLHGLEGWLEPSVNMATAPHLAAKTIWILLGVATAVGLLGIGLAWWLYGRGPSENVARFTSTEVGQGLYQASLNKLWVDEIYDSILVRPFRWLARGLFELVDRFIIDTVLVNGSAFVVSLFGRLIRWIQNGQVQRYMVGIILGAAAIFFFAGRASHPGISYRRVPQGIELKADPGNGLAGEGAKYRWDLDGDGEWDLRPEAKDRIAGLHAAGADAAIDAKTDYVNERILVRRLGEVGPFVRLEITDPLTGKTQVVSTHVELGPVAAAAPATGAR